MLRAVAALLVVLYHLVPHYLDAGGSFTTLASMAQWGFFGVDIFFVISGFVISYTVFPKERSLQSSATYFRHRLSRIFLGYWPFALLALFVVPLHNPQAMEGVSLLRTLTLTSSDLSLLALPVSWSLSYELYFYLIFGVLFCFSNRVIRNVLLVLFVLILLRTLFFDLDPDSNWAFWLSAYMLEFFYGVLIFLYRDALSQKRWLFPALLLAIGAFWLGMGQPVEHDNRVMYFGLSAAAIVLLALQLEANRWFTSPRWLVSLGDSSYALYLSHSLLIAVFYFSGLRQWLADLPQALTELGFLAVLLYIVFLSHFYYRRVERPIYLWAIGLKRSKAKAIKSS
jgi:peptidoglycan/LPS O-acetylase OafA/YrhL